MKTANLALIFTLSFSSISAFAEGSAQHSGQASKHSILASGHGVSSSVKVASAVTAVPFKVVGSVATTVGSASTKTGKALKTAANEKLHNTTLVITETTITADPAPNKVIISQQQKIVNKH